MSVEIKPFGILSDGSEVKLYILENENGLKASITDFGATLVDMITPDASGNFADINLGYDNLEGYVNDTCYFGATIGRYGNRIAGGTFELNGEVYELPKNEDGKKTLHGGPEGFNKRLWQGEIIDKEGVSSVRFRLTSPDGDQGFPGLLEVACVYTLTPENGLKIEYIADCTAPTVVSMTHHSYFNLSGADSGKDVLGYELYLDAPAITPVDAEKIPTGEFMPVADTPFDFNIMKKIGQDINSDHEQMQFGGGYDHNFVLNTRDHLSAPAVIAIDPESGRKMEVYTSNPAVQLYTGNFLDGTVTGKNGVAYQQRTGFCIEPQLYPDSPNKPHFPTSTLLPGEKYYEIIEYRFPAL